MKIQPDRKALGFGFLLLLCTVSFLRADTLIVLNKSEATASLMDPETGTTVATVPTGTGPHEVAVSPNGQWAVVTNYGDQQPGSSLTVIDISAGRSLRTVSLGRYRRPHGIAWLEDSTCLVTVEDNRAVILVDVVRGAVTKSIATDQNVSHMVAVSPDHNRAYIANIGSGSVTVLDLKNGKWIANVPTGAGAEGIDITPDGKEVWISNREADTVSVLDTTTLKVVATLESKSFPIRVRITPDGSRALVTNARSGEVSIFNTKSKEAVGKIRIPESATTDEAGLLNFGSSPVPIGVLANPGGKHVYVALSNADAVAILDLEKRSVLKSLKTGKQPDGLGYSRINVTRDPQ